MTGVSKMKFYKAGRIIRNIDELELGKVYSVLGVVGQFVEQNGTVYDFDNKEEFIRLRIGRSELVDRINMGFVRAIKKSWKPRPETILKIMGSTKK